LLQVKTLYAKVQSVFILSLTNTVHVHTNCELIKVYNTTNKNSIILITYSLLATETFQKSTVKSCVQYALMYNMQGDFSLVSMGKSAKILLSDLCRFNQHTPPLISVSVLFAWVVQVSWLMGVSPVVPRRRLCPGLGCSRSPTSVVC